MWASGSTPTVLGRSLVDDFDELGLVSAIFLCPLEHVGVNFGGIARCAVVNDGLQVRLPHTLPLIDIAEILFYVRHGDRVATNGADQLGTCSKFTCSRMSSFTEQQIPWKGSVV